MIVRTQTLFTAFTRALAHVRAFAPTRAKPASGATPSDLLIDGDIAERVTASCGIPTTDVANLTRPLRASGRLHVSPTTDYELGVRSQRYTTDPAL